MTIHKVTFSSISKWQEELAKMCHTPERLNKLCVFTIRQNMRQRRDEDFCQLHLPHGLLPSVTLSGLAEELYQMYPHEINSSD